MNFHLSLTSPRHPNTLHEKSKSVFEWQEAFDEVLTLPNLKTGNECDFWQSVSAMAIVCHCAKKKNQKDKTRIAKEQMLSNTKCNANVSGLTRGVDSPPLRTWTQQGPLKSNPNKNAVHATPLMFRPTHHNAIALMCPSPTHANPATLDAESTWLLPSKQTAQVKYILRWSYALRGGGQVRGGCHTSVMEGVTSQRGGGHLWVG